MRPAVGIMLAVVGATLAIAACGDDPTTATGHELPLVDGAETVRMFDEPNGIVDATVRFVVVTSPGISRGAELVDRERTFLSSEGWRVHRDGRVPEAWVAQHEDVEDFIRFGRVEPIREAAMTGHEAGDLTDSRSTLRRAMLIQISPPGPY